MWRRHQCRWGMGGGRTRMDADGGVGEGRGFLWMGRWEVGYGGGAGAMAGGAFMCGGGRGLPQRGRAEA